MKQYFTNKILKWHNKINRPLPWKGEKNPYVIWLSEIILQQTRVNQGLPYFLKFKEQFPDVGSLAKADEDEILKLWQGLGYYSRARNLHEAARFIDTELNGCFPDNYDDIRKLKGVGDYTAAAIASFAFNMPYAVVDGNVYRVLSRFYGISTPIDSTRGKKEFHQFATELIPRDNPGIFNQAIMDFGAIQCIPAKPDCQLCPLKNKCSAFLEERVFLLPVKSKRMVRTNRYFHYLFIKEDNYLFISKRNGNDIWKNLYEFPLIEGNRVLGEKGIMKTKRWFELFKDQRPDRITLTCTYNQTLTHQKIHARFYEVNGKNWNLPGPDVIKINVDFLNNFAFPKVIDWYLKNKTLYSKID